MFSNKKPKGQEDQNPLIIRDMSMFFYTFFVGGMITVCLYYLNNFFNTPNVVGWIGWIAILPPLYLTARLIVIYKGNKIDFKSRTFTYVGSRAMNGLVDLFSWKWLGPALGIARQSITLDDIYRIEIINQISLDGERGRFYCLAFEGEFGAARIKFDSYGQINRLYSALRQELNMGTPINI